MLTSSRIDDNPDSSLRIPRRMIRARQVMINYSYFAKGVRGFQAFVPFVLVLSFSLFQICLVCLDNAILISQMGILLWTRNS